MRKSTATAAFAAAGVAVLGAAAPAMAGSGVDAGEVSLVNVDASSLAHWQICGQNILTQSFGQDCDNRDHIGAGPQSGIDADEVSLINADASSAAHWQICGQNVLTQSFGQDCDNADHITSHGHHHHDDGGKGHPPKGTDQGDH